jgi:nitrite reductase/ring-hydroxylating ferredoxin subunit
MDRREFIRRASLVLVFGAVGVASVFEVITKLSSSSQAVVITPPAGQSQSQSQSLQAPAGYIFVAPMTALSGKSSAYFNHPTQGSSILVDYGGQWKAFSSVCTHAGCTVQFTGSSVYCPCHAGYFSPTNGSVQGGPPMTPLPEFGVVVQNGSLYVSQSRIN